MTSAEDGHGWSRKLGGVRYLKITLSRSVNEGLELRPG